MATKKPTKRTLTPAQQEERARKVAELHDKLADSVLALTNEDNWRNYLAMGRILHHYSFSNLCLIRSQCPNATLVAGYNPWLKLGRQVRKGEKAIKIFGYSTKRFTVTVTDAHGNETEETRKRPYFPLVSVFDVSQTDGEPLPSLIDDLPEGDSGPIAYATYTRVAHWIQSIGWTVTREDLGEGVQGYTNHQEGKVVISDNLGDVNAAAVLLHEAAHVVLHAPDSKFVTDKQYASSRTHRGVAEIQADATAYVLADLFGMDNTGMSTGYVAGWATAASGSTDGKAIVEAIRATGDAIHHAVKIIVDGVNGEGENEDGEAAGGEAVTLAHAS